MTVTTTSNENGRLISGCGWRKGKGETAVSLRWIAENLYMGTWTARIKSALPLPLG